MKTDKLKTDDKLQLKKLRRKATLNSFVGFCAVTWGINCIWAGCMMLFSVENGIAAIGIFIFIPFLALAMPFIFLSGIMAAPLIALPALALAIIATVLCLNKFNLLKFNARSAFFGNFIFGILLVIFMQTIAYTVMTIKAREVATGKYCLRAKSIVNNATNTGGEVRMPHATLAFDNEVYIWSYKEMTFVPKGEQSYFASANTNCLHPKDR